MAIEPFRVLMVCWANKCRSPLAEHVLRQSLDPLQLTWVVDSAGIAARNGDPMHRLTQQMLSDRGLSIGDWTTRRLTADLIERADLILTAEAAHRSAVVTMCPNALQRTFPLLQFARLTSHIDQIYAGDSRECGTRLLGLALGARDKLQSALVGGDDLDDPIGQRAKRFRRCADQIDVAVGSILSPFDGRTR